MRPDIDCPKCGKKLSQPDRENYYCGTCLMWNPHEWWKKPEDKNKETI